MKLTVCCFPALYLVLHKEKQLQQRCQQLLIAKLQTARGGRKALLLLLLFVCWEKRNLRNGKMLKSILIVNFLFFLNSTIARFSTSATYANVIAKLKATETLKELVEKTLSAGGIYYVTLSWQRIPFPPHADPRGFAVCRIEKYR